MWKEILREWIITLIRRKVFLEKERLFLNLIKISKWVVKLYILDELKKMVIYFSEDIEIFIDLLFKDIELFKILI